MEYHFENMKQKHREAVIDVYNYFIEYTFAAYPEKKGGQNFGQTFDVIRMQKRVSEQFSLVRWSRGYHLFVIRSRSSVGQNRSGS